MPGVYLLHCWQTIRDLWPQMPKSVGIGLSINTNPVDPYDECPIASTLKACSTYHHTTNLGVLKTCSSMVWLLAHEVCGYGSPVISIKLMRNILSSDYHLRNGLNCHLIQNIGDLFKFNNIQQVWQKIFQFMLCWSDILGDSRDVQLFMVLCVWCLKLLQCNSDKQRQQLKELYVVWAREAADRWDDWINLLPKARILMDLVTELQLFGRFSYMNDIHTEHAHQLKKKFWQKYNNHKLINNGILTHKSNEFLEWVYALNGGRWGPELDIGFSQACLTLKDPFDNTKIHPFIQPFRMPVKQLHVPERIAITQSKNITLIWDWDEFGVDNKAMADLIDVLSFRWPDMNIEEWSDVTLCGGFELYQVKTWRIQDGLKSVTINYARKTYKQCWVKIHQNRPEIMQIKSCFVVIVDGHDPVRVAYGQIGAINQQNGDDLINGLWSNVDTVDWDHNEFGFRCMDFIDQSVMLKHKHIEFRNVRHNFGAYWWNINSQEWSRGFAVYRPKLVKEINDDTTNLLKQFLPCGAEYSCSEHTRLECATWSTECLNSAIKWKCNEQGSQLFCILDANHGWIPGLLNMNNEYFNFMEHFAFV